MNKPILLNKIEYSMLELIAKKSRLKPEQYLKKMIEEAYGKLR